MRTVSLMYWRGLLVALLLSSPCLTASPAWAEDSDQAASKAKKVRQDGQRPEDKETRAEAPDRPKDMPLSDLPAPPTLSLPSPRPRAVEAIDRILQELTSEDPVLRQRAAQSLLEAKHDWVSALSSRIELLRERSSPEKLKQLLESSRKREKKTKKGEPSPDYLTTLLETPEPENEVWKDLVSLLALSRMLTAIETTEATRELINIYVRFGEFMRIDCQRQLEELGDKAVAALIETERHQAPDIGSWAKKRLVLLGKDNPHDAVQTEDSTALADILVALGRNGDPETTQLLISFAGTEHTQIRTAARQGIVLIGEAGSWQLRDAYLNTTGKHPPRDWTWKRTARELFTEFDRLRLERVYVLYEQARKAKEAGKLTQMRDLFDHILALAPRFEQTELMHEGYLAFARDTESAPLNERLLAARRAERLSTTEEQSKVAAGLRVLLEAEELKEKGIVDRALLLRAVKLDKENESAVLKLSSPATVATWGATSRYLVAGVVALLALFGAAWIVLSGLRRKV